MPIPAPVAVYSDDLYHFSWPDFGLECILERFNERRDDIQVELTVTMTHPALGGRLFSGRLLLIGPNSRRDVKNVLAERVDDVDWAGVLEQMCQMARERYRKGEPVVDLYTVEAETRARYLVEPFVLDRAITIIYGDGATAKSSISLSWGVHVSLHTGPVLYLDWEDDAASHAERLRAICSGLGIEDVGHGIYYQRRSSRLAESVREVKRIVAEHGVSLVIIDSLGMAAGDPNDSNLVIEAMRAARSLGVAVLCIHHLPKNSLDKSKPFGTVYASNEARLTWLVEKAQEEDTEEFSVLLTNHKSNRSKQHAKRSMKVVFENSADDELVCLTVKEQRIEQVEAFRSKLPLWRHIAAVLRSPLSTSAIVKALNEDNRGGVSEAGIRRAINDHKREFVNVGSHSAAVWALAENQHSDSRTVAYGREPLYAR
jgi:hypothetical protein